MSARCPNGHTSQALDYCDVCGTPIPEGSVVPDSVGSGSVAAATPAGVNSLDLPPVGGGMPPAPSPGGLASGGGAAGGGASGAPGGAASTGPKECPNCSTPNSPDSLFCEACGYDFTTGALPAGVAASAPAAGLGLGGSGQGGAEGSGSASAGAGAGESGQVATEGESAAGQSGGGEHGAADPAAAASGHEGGGSGIPPRIPFQWVAEVWIDPDWYADQQATDPLPSPGLPVVVPLRIASALIGRVSTSRNIVPDIDCSADPGVSRRHAQLTTDGSRWFVEDLQSSNGTYVGPASGPLPDDPIPVGPKTEVGDNRIYVGAWTRIVVRRATDEEIAVG